MPYALAKDFLKNIKNPMHLHEIEEMCPHIADQDADLWKAFIARDIPDWEAKMIYPKNPRSWWKVYRKLMREEELLEAAHEEALRKQLTKDTIKKSEQSTTFVPQVVKCPAVKDADVGVARGAHLRANAAGWQWRETQKPKSGERIVNSILRQTAASHKTRQPAHSGTSLEAAKRQIPHAPATMITRENRVQPRELLPHQKALLDEYRGNRMEIVVPESRIKKSKAIADALAQKREINEKRLRELTNSRPLPVTPKFELTTPARERWKETLTEGQKLRGTQWIQSRFASLEPKHAEEESGGPSASLAKSASPQSWPMRVSQPADTSQPKLAPRPRNEPPPQPALVKRKRPAATNIFMAKKQKK